MNNAYGKLRLESGVRQQVGFLYVDGDRLPSGLYGATAAPGVTVRTDLFEGAGVLEVTGGQGFMVVVR